MGNRNPLLWLSATVLTLLIIALMVSQDVTANVKGLPKRVGAGYGVVNIARKHCDTRAQEKNLQWKGRYTNPEYGYSLAIPHGLIGVTPSSPLPQHTIEILL